MVYCSRSTEELKKYITDVKSTVVFTLNMFQDKFEQIVNEAKIKTVIIANLTQSMSLVNRFGAKYIKGMKSMLLPKDSRFIDWKQYYSKGRSSDITFHAPEAAAIITYTGGTIGGSKGAVLSNKAVNAVAKQYILGEPELNRDSK